MPSKAFKLAEAMISNPVMSDIVTNTAAVPVSITNQIEISTDQGVATVNDLPNIGNNTGDIQLVESTNRLYVWNGSGWYNIALINTTPAWDSGGQPAASYELDADSPQNATIISLAASDPEGLPINYTYVTSGQMNSIATISQDSSVFTITPKTAAQVPDGGTGSITFRATDGVNILPQVSSFTLNFISTVTNSKHTSLLATATGTSDNNNITDASTNNHTITVNGDAHAGTFSPYRSGGYSIYFDGTSGIRSDPSTGSTLQGATTFTVEFWYNTKTITSGNKVIWGSRNYTSSTNTDDTIGRMFQNGGNLYYDVNASTVVQLNSVISADTWYYIALVVDSGALSLYLDGTRVATATYTSPNASDIIAVGHTGNTPQQYIADFRINTAAEYSGTNHTVPTESLPSTSDTVFHLTKGYYGEWSLTSLGTNFTTPVITPFSPYDYLEYSAADHGGSIYFDGTGDNLQLPSVLPAGAFTVSCWVYFNTEDYCAVWSQGTAGNAGRTSIQALGSRNLYFAIGGTSVTSRETDISPKSWYYIEAQYSGSQIELFINGFSVGTASTTTNPQNTNFHVGTLGSAWDSSYELDGYVSDLKVVSGTPSGSSTVPTAPQSSSGTLLHIKGTDASIIDKSQGSNLKLVGNTTGSTTQVKFANTKTMYFDGIDDHIVGPTVSDLNIGTGDFTAECWIYETTLNTNKGIWDGRSTGSTTDGFTFTRINTDAFRIWSGGALITTDPVTIQNTWVHCAVVRYNGTLTIYINGSSSGTPVSNSTNFSNSGTFIIGAGRHGPGATATAFITGYIQDLRVSNYARYTATDETSNIPSAPLEG